MLPHFIKFNDQIIPINKIDLIKKTYCTIEIFYNNNQKISKIFELDSEAHATMVNIEKELREYKLIIYFDY